MKRVLTVISEFLKTLWLYIAGIIAVGAIYFLLTGIEQGVDVVIQAGEYKWPGIASIVAVPLWSFLVWYSCRLLSYAKQSSGTTIPANTLQLVPRLLAYNCFICVQAAIFALPTFFCLSFLQIVLFILLHNAFYYFLNKWFADKEKYAAVVSVVFIVLMLAIYICCIVSAQNIPFYKRHRFWLPFVGMTLFVLQVAVVYFFIKRREYIDGKMGGIQEHPIDSMKAPVAKSKFIEAEAAYIRFFNIVALVSIVLYCAAIFNIRTADEMGPMAFLLLALGVLVGFSNIISYYSIRVKINLFLFIFILAVIIGKFGDPYEIRMLPPVGKTFYESRPDIKTYIHRWVTKRQALLDRYIANKDTFHVYLVLSDGGASRAGNWVCSVMGGLQDASNAKDSTNTFSDHLFAISGASGGSVGNAAFYSMLRARQQGLLHDSMSTHTYRFFNADFLTYTLGRLLGPDFFRHLLPIHGIMDRGAALETVLANGSMDPIIDPQLNKPLSEALDTSGALPIFFITTTRVQDGMPGILSSVQLPINSQRVNVPKLFDSMDIRFATAAILSSRFPYVSPAGCIKNNYFVDGGYVDNAGSGIMLDLLDELEMIARDTTDSLVNKYRRIMAFHVIHIFNSPVTEEVFKPIPPLTNDLLTPLLTLAGMQGASTRLSTASLELYFRDFNSDTTNAIINFGLYPTDWKPSCGSKSFCFTNYSDSAREAGESFPMSWVISCYQLERMHMRLLKANEENASKFWFLKAGK